MPTLPFTRKRWSSNRGIELLNFRTLTLDFLVMFKIRIDVEVALRDFHKPIGVAEYKTIFP
jgi:hypothetical protein